MTEAEWLTGTDVMAKLSFVSKRLSFRQLHLFACHCCVLQREIRETPVEEAAYRAVIAEAKRIAVAVEGPDLWDGWEARYRSLRRLQSAQQAVLAEEWIAQLVGRRPRTADLREEVVRAEFSHEVVQLFWNLLEGRTPWLPGIMELLPVKFQPRWLGKPLLTAADALRDLIGNPFRREDVRADWLHWNDGLVRHIAERIECEGHYDEVGILGDALLDAGCDSVAILQHCHAERGHLPGCWLVDAVLGRDPGPGFLAGFRVDVELAEIA